MKSSLSLLIVVAVGAGLTACGQSQAKKLTKAPSTQAEAGVLIKGANANTDAVIAVSSSFRVISQKHGIYEVHGLSQDQIKTIAPELTVEKNQVYQSLIPGLDRKAPWAMNVAQDDEMPASDTEAVPPIFEGCDLQATETPTAEIGLNNDSLNDMATSELGSQVDFNSTDSAAHAENPSELEKRWEIFAPARSKVEAGVRPGSSLKFLPDNVGYHQVALVVKDDKNACGLQVARFIVSWNPAMNLPQAGDEKPTVDLEHFDHLPRVNAEKAWEKATGKGVVIAVLDTGLNYNHGAIRFNLAVNKAELNGSANTDNDNNQYKDDILGWDFINNDNNPYDDEGHGSHVSGLAASHIFGLAPEAKIMPLKVLNGAGGGDAGSILAGIYYAADNGATVINASLGATIDSFKMLKEGLVYANTKGVVAIVSAGNGDENGVGLDIGTPGIDYYPAELDVANIVTIAATDENDVLTTYSNYGNLEVDVAGPGGDGSHPMWSLATQNASDQSFAPSAGTSMSAPVVAGIAALVQEVKPNLSPSEVKSVLIKSGKDVGALNGKLVSGKVIGALDAINKANSL